MKIDEPTKFAITLALLPCIPAFLLHKHAYDVLAIQVLSVFLVLSITCFISKSFAKKFKDVLTSIGNFLGKYIAIIVLAIGYIVAVLPTGLLMKIVKRDRLRLNKPQTDTYWIDCDKQNTDYEYQF